MGTVRDLEEMERPVKSRYQATIVEGIADWEDLIRAVLNCWVCGYSYLQLRSVSVQKIQLPIQTPSIVTVSRDSMLHAITIILRSRECSTNEWKQHVMVPSKWQCVTLLWREVCNWRSAVTVQRIIPCTILASFLILKPRSSGKNKSPTYFWYDTNRIENDASNNSSLPRERVYQAVATIGGYTDSSIDSPLIPHGTYTKRRLQQFFYCCVYFLP
jgi:hypothetical protein